MRLTCYALLLALLFSATASRADETTDRGAPRSSSARDSSRDARDEAARRFSRGLELFGEADFSAALVEFRRAYALAPNYRVLYNIGQVCYQLQNYACALQSFDQYLSDGGSDIPSARRAAVDGDLDKLRARVARVTVRTNVRGATVLVDDVPVGKAPLSEPLIVSSGQRRITVSVEGRAPLTRSVSLAGEETTTVNLEFSQAPPRPEPPPVSPLPARGGVPSWPFWSAGAALAVGAGITGALALGANSELSRKRDTFGVTPDDLRSTEHRASTFALATDVLGALAVVSGGVALYATFSTPERGDPLVSTAPKQTGVRVTVGAGRVEVVGRF